MHIYIYIYIYIYLFLYIYIQVPIYSQSLYDSELRGTTPWHDGMAQHSILHVKALHSTDQHGMVMRCAHTPVRSQCAVVWHVCACI